MSHEYVKVIRFGEVDQAQVVYYPRLLHFCHLAMEDFFEDKGGLPYAELVRDRGVGFPAVHLESDFQKPMRFGDRVTITLDVVSVGRSSVVTRYRFLKDDGTPCAEVRVTTACIDMERFASREIPDDVRRLLEAHRAE